VTAQIGAEAGCEFSYEWREVGTLQVSQIESIATNCKGIRKVRWELILLGLSRGASLNSYSALANLRHVIHSVIVRNTRGVPYIMTRRLPHPLSRDQLWAGVVAINRVVFISHFPCFAKGVTLYSIPARVGLCWNYMPPADDCRKRLESLEVYKASINKSLASLAQCEFARVEIAPSFQQMTARGALKLQSSRKPVLTSFYRHPFSICVVTRSVAFGRVVDQCWCVETFRVSLRILCCARG